MGLSCGSSTLNAFEQPPRSRIPATARSRLARSGKRNSRMRCRRDCMDGTLLHGLEAIFLNHGIGEDFFGDALQLRLRFIAVPAIEIEDEEFALAYVGNLG